MTKDKRIQLDPAKLLGFKHLVAANLGKLELAAAMVGNLGGGGGGGKIGFSRLPSLVR